MVDLIINNSYSKIHGELSLDIIDSVSEYLSYTQPGSQFTMAVKRGGWDGKIRLLKSDLSFPSGLAAPVSDLLKQKGLLVDIQDRRENIISSPLGWLGPSLYPHQEKLVESALSHKRGTLSAATGFGKSLCIAKIVAELNTTTVIYVISLDLLSQLKETMEGALGQEIGCVGGGICDIKKINVVSLWTAVKSVSKEVKASKMVLEEDVVVDKWTPDRIQQEQIANMVKSAKLVLLDESHFSSCDSIQEILKHSHSATYRFGLSGSPYREDGTDILLTAAFGPIIHSVTASDLIKTGYLVPPKIVFRDIPAIKVKKDWMTVKSKYIVNNSIRNNILIDNTKRLLDRDRKPLILFREIAHGKILESLMPSDVKHCLVNGQLDMDRRQEIRNDFKAGKIDCLIASTIFDTGIDLPMIDAIILAAGGKSRGRALQRIGRGIRPYSGKSDCLIVDTFDDCHFVKKHSIARYETYKTEPLFKILAGPEMTKHMR